MNQNLPPNSPGQPGEYSSDDQQGSNPYYAAQQQAPQSQPNLDAGAPQLKTVESQSVNRKALMFLAGIVALLILMTLVVMKGFMSDKEEEVAKPKKEEVVIPDLPKSPGGTGPDFADVQEPQPVPVQELPPLPPQEPMQERDPRRDAAAAEAGPPEPRGPTLAERRMGMVDSGGRGGGAGPGGMPQTSPYLQAVLDAQASQQNANAPAQAVASTETKQLVAQYLRNPDTLMVRGTYIRCVLETRIVTDYAGYTSCIITEPVYSINGRHLLLPKGSKALGRYEGEPNGPRVAVVWDRVTTPNGLDVILEGPGVDNLGGAGHPGDYNGHWFSKMSSALFISMISDAFKYAAAKNGPTTTSVSNGTIVETPFESNTARTVERLANQALTKAAQRPATVTINQGTVLNIYVAKDVDFSGVVRSR